MKIAAVLVAIVTSLGIFALTSQASHLGCHTSNAQAFAALRDDPPYLVGTIPNRLTSDAAYFSVRYSCSGQLIQVQHRDTGVYEMRFPRVKVRLALATAISDEGVSASVHLLGDGVVRVVLRGPLSGNDVAALRDVPFAVVVF